MKHILMVSKLTLYFDPMTRKEKKRWRKLFIYSPHYVPKTLRRKVHKLRPYQSELLHQIKQQWSTLPAPKRLPTA